MTEDNKNRDLEEILVRLPLTDTEIFGHILLGIKPDERPVKMTRGTYKSIKRFYSIVLTGVLTLGAIHGFSNIKKDYGSISQAFKSFMENLEKIPWNAVFTP